MNAALKPLFKTLQILVVTLISAYPTKATLQSAQEVEFFEKKDDDFWVIKNHDAFIKASEALIDKEGKWPAHVVCPEYIQYLDVIEEKDLPQIDKWLRVNGLQYFSIKADTDFHLIYPWFSRILEEENEVNKKRIYKLIWLSLKSTLRQLELDELADLPHEWLEKHHAYHLKSSHYNEKVLEDKDALARPLINISQENNERVIEDKNALANPSINLPQEIQATYHWETIISFIYDPEDYVSFMTTCKAFDKLGKNYLYKEERKYQNKDADFKLASREWRLGWAYYYSFFGRENIIKAVPLLENSSQQEQKGSMALLGAMYLYGNYVDQDPGYAIEHLLTPAANKGSPKAQYTLGKLYFSGEHMPRNEELARQWYLKAAEQGNTKAMVALGNLFDNYHSPLKNPKAAAEWFYRATERAYSTRLWSEATAGLYRIDNPTANLLIAKAYERKGNYFLALPCYEKAFNKGVLGKMNKKALTELQKEVLENLKNNFDLFPDYQCTYGELLLEKSNYKDTEGLQALEGASQRGSVKALYLLGGIYEEGKGIKADPDKALDFYRQAALIHNYREAQQRIYEIAGMGRDQGNPKAQFLMGKIAQDKKNYSEAFTWFQRAANQGSLEASQEVGIAYFKGEGTAKSPTSAQKYLEEPARQGLVQAQYYLGKLYLEGGRGVNKDQEKALELLRAAAAKNHTEAHQLMSSLNLEERSNPSSYKSLIRTLKNSVKHREKITSKQDFQDYKMAFNSIVAEKKKQLTPYAQPSTMKDIYYQLGKLYYYYALCLAEEDEKEDYLHQAKEYFSSTHLSEKQQKHIRKIFSNKNIQQLLKKY